MLKKLVILKRPGRSLRMMKRQYVFFQFNIILHTSYLLAVFIRDFTVYFRWSSGQDMLVRMFLITVCYPYYLIYEHVHLSLEYFITCGFMFLLWLLCKVFSVKCHKIRRLQATVSGFPQMAISVNQVHV